jgi:hypothetical protein
MFKNLNPTSQKTRFILHYKDKILYKKQLSHIVRKS